MLGVKSFSSLTLHDQQQQVWNPPSQVMTAKKPRNRNVFKQEKIERRGISTSSPEVPPPLQETSTIPLEYLQSVSEAISQYAASSVSEQSSPVVSAPNRPMYSESSWTTGNSTERSSLFSWADDEFDRQASQRVREMFDEIDSLLYEVTKPVGAGTTLQSECKDWRNSFPHLRILGMQLLSPGDDGYKAIPRETFRPPTAGELLDVGDHELPGRESHGLVIQGRPLVAEGSASHSRSHPEEEEVIESDGIVEEYLAYDHCRLSDEGHERKQHHTPRRRQGYPPITPNALRHNSVCSSAFDVLWEEIVGWLRDLVNKQMEEQRFQTSHESDPLSRSRNGHTAPGYEISLYGSDYPGRLDQPLGRLAPMVSGLKFTPGPSFNLGLFNQKSSLTGVMTISSKALHNRLGDKERTPPLFGEDGTFPFTRPSSTTFFPRARPGSTKLSDLHGSRLSSARGGKGRLKPLERAMTPAMEGVVTGTKIVSVGDRLGSPPQPLAVSPPRNWSRNAMLPPIEREHSNLTKENLRLHRGSARIRISSAVTADDRRQPPKERIAPFVFDTRPNTTHAFRTDTPIGGITRRSSTSLIHGTNVLKPGTPATQGAPNFVTGITGVSLGIPGTPTQMDSHPYESPTAGYLRLL